MAFRVRQARQTNADGGATAKSGGPTPGDVNVILDHPQWPVGRYLAVLPVEQGGRPKLYFHGLGAAVRWAVESGKPGLVVGKGLPDLKKRLGAELVAQYAAAVPVW